jgi:two-component system, cell cycle response regulator DivK
MVMRITEAMTLVSGRHPRSGPAIAPFPLDAPEDDIRASRGRPVVLLVDDIDDCRDVYGQFLKHTGYDVVEASDGFEALAKAGALVPDIIVMDLWMPHLDGWESIRRLKSAPATARIPILVLTGDAYAQARTEAEAAGCQAYMVKPCLPMDVAAAVGRLVMESRSGGSPPAVKVLSERRAAGAGGRRESETGGGVLASVVADVERRSQELSRELGALDAELQGAPAGSDVVRARLRKAEEATAALSRHVEALKLIARSADVTITIPARRPRKP